MPIIDGHEQIYLLRQEDGAIVYAWPDPEGGGGGGGSTSPLLFKGDLWGFDTADARVPVGNNGQVLTADSSAALGLAWVDAPLSYILPAATTITLGGVLLDRDVLSGDPRALTAWGLHRVPAAWPTTDYGLFFGDDDTDQESSSFLYMATASDNAFVAPLNYYAGGHVRARLDSWGTLYLAPAVDPDGRPRQSLTIDDNTTGPSLNVNSSGSGESLRLTHTDGSTFSIDAHADIVTTGTIAAINGFPLTDGQILIGNSASGKMDVGTLAAGSGVSITQGAGTIQIASTVSGTVTSVALTAPAAFSVAGSPVTTAGSLDLSWASQSAHTALMAPASGAGIPAFRTLVAGDIPSLDTSVLGTGILGSAHLPSDIAYTDVANTFSLGQTVAVTDAVTGAATTVLTLAHNGGVGAASEASRLRYQLSNDGGALRDAAYIDALWAGVGSPAAAGAEYSGLAFYTRSAGGALACNINIDANSHLVLGQGTARATFTGGGTTGPLVQISATDTTTSVGQMRKHLILTNPQVSTGTGSALSFGWGTEDFVSSIAGVVTNLGGSVVGDVVVTTKRSTADTYPQESLRVDNLGTTWINKAGNFAVGTVGLVVRGSSGQSADLEQWQNSSGTVLSSITSTGALVAPDLVASGLAGATAASRYVGATVSGAPVSGTFAVGDFVVTQNGEVWINTMAGTPGTWTQAGGAGSYVLPDATTAVIGGVLIDQTPLSGHPIVLTVPRLGAVSGVAELDSGGHVPLAELSGLTTSQLAAAAGIVSGQIASVAASTVTGLLGQTHGGTGIDSSAVTDGQLLVGKTSDHSLNLATLTAGTGVTITNGAGAITINAVGGSGGVGTVTSVDVSAPAPLASSGGPVTSTGTIALSWASGQAANRVLASPDGVTGAVSLRPLGAADLPLSSTSAVGAVKPGRGLVVTADGTMMPLGVSADQIASVAVTTMRDAPVGPATRLYMSTTCI